MEQEWRSKYDSNALRQNQRNIVWLSVSFSFIYFGNRFFTLIIIGINTFKNFVVPFLGNQSEIEWGIGSLGASCLGILYAMAAIGNFIVPAILYLAKSERSCLIVSGFAMWYSLYLLFSSIVFISSNMLFSVLLLQYWWALWREYSFQ